MPKKGHINPFIKNLKKAGRMKKNANVYGFIAMILWSVSALIVYFTPSLPPMLLASMASFIGFLMCLIYWSIRRESFLSKLKMSLEAYCLGVLGICGYISLWLVGLKLAPPFEANALNYMWPLLLMIFSSRIDKTPITTVQMTGLVLGMIGCMFIFARHLSNQESQLYIYGLYCAFGGAVIWSIYSSLTKVIHFESDRVGIFLLITAIITFSLHVIFDKKTTIDYSVTGGIAIFMLGLTRVSFIFWDKAMKHGDRQMLASLSYLIPAMSVTLLAIFTPVLWTWQITIGSFLIVCGCIITNYTKLLTIATHQQKNTL